MNTKTIPALLLLLVLTASAFGQSSRQVLSVPTIADLEARTPQSGEVIEVQNGSATNLWSAPRTFTFRTNSETADRVHVVTNKTAGTRYISTDRNSRPQKASWWGMVGDGVTDNAAAFAAMLANTRDIEIARGRYAFATPIAITNAESISIVSPDGSYQGGYHSTNLVTEAEFLYTGPATNIFFDFKPAPNGTLRYGNRIENVSFNANGLADTCVRIGTLGRGRFVGCRFLGATGVNWLIDASQFCTFIDCSTSINDETPTPTVRPVYGLSLTNFSPCNVFIDCQIENSTTAGVLMGINAKNNNFVGGAIESNDGDGLVLESSANNNIFSGTWFENNGGTNSIWVKSGAIQNTFTGLRLFEDIGAIRVAGSYNTFQNFGASKIWIEASGTRNKWENMIWVDWFVDETFGGNTFRDLIDSTATIRTNTLSSPFVQYGEPFKLWNGTNTHERASLQFGGIYFGDGSNPPDAGWSRLSASSLSTSNTVVFLPQGVNDTLVSAYAPGDAQPRVRLTVGQSLSFGPGGATTIDTTLRRLSSATLLADDTSILALRTNVNALGFGAGITNDTATRIAMTAGGRLLFGDGASSQTASISFDSSGTIRVTTNLVVDGAITLGGVARSSWPSGSGTNASTVFFDGTAVDAPNILSGPEILLTIAGLTNITPTIKTNSIGTNQFNNTTYSAVFSGAIAESRVDAAIARLLSPAFTGSPTAPTAADGVSNTVLATTAWVLRNVAGGGGVGDVTLAGTNLFTGPNTFGGLTVVSNLTVPGTLAVGSITSDTPLGMSIGGTGGTNAESARSSLGVAHDVDVQAYRLELLQAALALTADGHMLYRNGSMVTNLASTAAGRSLLTAASASAQWNSYLLSVATTNGAYDASAWNGVTDRTVTLDQFRDAITALPGGSNAITSVTAPLSLTDGVLSIDTSGLGGGGGGVTWLTNVALGAWQGRDAGTNWPVMTFSISSNDVPSTIGQYLFGEVSCVISNYSGGSATLYFNTSVDGTNVFRDSYVFNNTLALGRIAQNHFMLIRETTNTLSILGLGGHAATAVDTGIGDSGSSMSSWNFVATNVPWGGGNVALAFSIQSESTNATPTALGLRRTAASLLKYSATTDFATAASVEAVRTNLDAGNIKTGVLSSNLLPSAVAFTSLSVGTITATAVTGDASGLTGINATNITAGTLPDARLAATIARTNAPTLHSPELLGSPTVPTAAAGTSNTVAASTKYVDDAVAAGGGGSVATDAIFDAVGDLPVGSGANTAARLPVGKIGDTLRYDGTNLVWVSSRNWWKMYFEGGASASSGDFASANGNGGTAFAGGYNGEAFHPGIIGGTTGNTTTNGYTSFTSRLLTMAGGSGSHYFEIWLKTPAAMPSAEPYILSAGFLDSGTGTAIADGGFFRLSNSNGDVWQAVTVTNTTAITTNSLVTAAAASTWYHLRGDIAGGGSRMVFSINDTPVATNTVNIPTGIARGYGVGIVIVEDGGVTNYNQTVYIDSINAEGFR